MGWASPAQPISPMVQRAQNLQSIALLADAHSVLLVVIPVRAEQTRRLPLPGNQEICETWVSHNVSQLLTHLKSPKKCEVYS